MGAGMQKLTISSIDWSHGCQRTRTLDTSSQYLILEGVMALYLWRWSQEDAVSVPLPRAPHTAWLRGCVLLFQRRVSGRGMWLHWAVHRFCCWETVIPNSRGGQGRA